LRTSAGRSLNMIRCQQICVLSLTRRAWIIGRSQLANGQFTTDSPQRSATKDYHRHLGGAALTQRPVIILGGKPHIRCCSIGYLLRPGSGAKYSLYVRLSVCLFVCLSARISAYKCIILSVITVQGPRSIRSSCLVTVARPPALLRITARSCFSQHGIATPKGLYFTAVVFFFFFNASS